MAKGELYRGYIAWTYEGEERVETIKPSHSEVWQSRQRLEERLQERLAELRPKVTMEYDLEAHIETIHTDIMNKEDD